MRARSSASRHRLGARVRVPVGVAADPRAEAERRPRPGQVAPVVGEQPLGCVDQALLEEPVAVADLVDNARTPRPHLVRLPEERDLGGERLDLAATRCSGSSSSASSAAIRRCDASTVRRVASVGCAVSTSWSDTSGARSRRRRSSERPRATRHGHAPRARTRAGGGRGAAARRRSRAGSRDANARSTLACRSSGSAATASRSSSCGAPARARAGERPHALDVVEQRLVFLLDEHPAEQVAEQADVAPERCIRPLHRVTVGAKRSAFLLTR